MLHAVLLILLIVGFAGAGVFNAIGTENTRNGFVRWGYPAWWCRVTGAIEIAIAALIAWPATRLAGLALGAVVMAAAAAAVLRHREFGHLAPIGAFVVLIVAVAIAP